MIDGMYALAMFFAVMLPVLVRVVIGTIRKDEWGINLKEIRCPRCGERFPPVRKPMSSQQALWGGWICPKCGCEVDKWGREVEELKKKESEKE